MKINLISIRYTKICQRHRHIFLTNTKRFTICKNFDIDDLLYILLKIRGCRTYFSAIAFTSSPRVLVDAERKMKICLNTNFIINLAEEKDSDSVIIRKSNPHLAYALYVAQPTCNIKLSKS